MLLSRGALEEEADSLDDDLHRLEVAKKVQQEDVAKERASLQQVMQEQEKRHSLEMEKLQAEKREVFYASERLH